MRTQWSGLDQAHIKDALRYMKAEDRARAPSSPHLSAGALTVLFTARQRSNSNGLILPITDRTDPSPDYGGPSFTTDGFPLPPQIRRA